MANGAGKLYSRCAILAVASYLVAPTAGFAQSVPASGANDGALADIIVTAQKRAENIQAVPLTIVAVGSEQLEASGIRTVGDLPIAVPGLVISRTGNGVNQAFIRGIGTDSNSIAADPSVALYINGIYVARPNAVMQDMADVERVEVLKGPQGTLYGRNATGGAISIVSRRPSVTPQADLDVTVGNYGTARVLASASGPLGEGFAVRISALYSDNDGYQKNLSAPGRRQFGDKTNGGRISFDYTNKDDTVGARLIFDYNRTESLLLGEKVFGNGYAVQKVGAPDNPDTVDIDACQCADQKQWGITGEVAIKFGDLTFKSLSGYRNDKLDMIFDIDATSLDFVTGIAAERSNTFSQEFQLSSSSEARFKWIVGLYYFHEDGLQDYNIIFKNPLGDSPFGAFGDHTFATNKTNSYAVYGQATYSISDTLRLTAGARYTKESKNFYKLETLTIAPPFVQGPVEQTFKAFTPKASLEYNPAQDVLLYLSATRGFKSGGFTALGRPDLPFRPEKIWSYAVGIKATVLDRKLRFNAEGFYYDYTDLQISRIRPDLGLINTVNADAASVKGIDAEIVGVPASGLEISARLSWLDAKFTDFLTANPNEPQLGILNLKGNSFTRAPKYSGTFSIQYEYRTGNNGRLTLRGDVNAQTRQYFDIYNDPTVSQKAYALLNMRISYRTPDEAWQLALFANNLTNKTYYNSGVRGDGLVGSILRRGSPRLFGLQASYSYR